MSAIVILATPQSIQQEDEWAQVDVLHRGGKTFPTLTVDQLIPKVKTGDVFLFGAHWPSSAKFKILQKSPFSHVGIALVRGEQVYIIESTTNNNIPDAFLNVCLEGVQTTLLKNRIEIYWGHVIWRPLTIERTPELLAKFEDFFQKYNGTHYETKASEVIGATIRSNRGEDWGSFFCSELAAAVYKYTGLLTADNDLSNNIWPADFSVEGSKPIKLIEGASLGEEHEILREELTYKYSEAEFLTKVGFLPTSQELESAEDVLQIDLETGKNLGKISKPDGIRAPDCFVTFSIGFDIHDNIPNRSVQSRFVRSEFDPAWNQKLFLKYPSKENHKYVLRILVEDHDPVKNDFIGAATLYPHEWKLQTNETKQFNIKLIDGEISFKLTRLHNKSVETHLP